MKKALTLVALNLATITIIGEEQKRQVDDAHLKVTITYELCSGHHPPIEMDENGEEIPYEFPTAADIAKMFNVSSNRMARVLEEMVRENLIAFEANPDVYTALKVFPLITELQTFHSTNSIALLQKSVMVNHDIISENAIETYAIIAGTKSIPFFRETIKKERLDSALHNRITQHLQKAVVKLEEKKQTADAEKITAFLKEMKQAEQPKEKGEN